MKKRMIIILTIFLILGLSGCSVFGLFADVDDLTPSDVSVGKIHNPQVKMAQYIEDSEPVSIGEGFPGFEVDMITCFASRKTSSNPEEYISFSDLIISLQYSAEIMTRIRVKIKDTWISQKLYSSGKIISTVINKDTEDHFNFAANWKYNETTSYAYYENDIAPSDTISLACLNNNGYVYDIDTGLGYRETIIVKLKFEIEIVQANRALEVWGEV